MWACAVDACGRSSLCPGRFGSSVQIVEPLVFLASHLRVLEGLAVPPCCAGSPCTVSRCLLSPPHPRHKEEVYENVHSKSKKEEKVKKQRSADKEKNKGSLKRK